MAAKTLLAALLTSSLALTTAAHAAETLEHPSIKLSVGGSVSQMNKVPYVVALYKGYFKDEGLDVETSNFSSGTAALQALVGGSADVSEIAYEHTLRMQAKHVGIVCLATFGRYPGNVLVVRKSLAGSVHTVADLKGKVIGVSAPGSSTQNFVAQLLEQAGVPWKSATYVSVGTGSSAVAAMRTGHELDALVNLDPAINELVDHGEADILVDSRTEKGSFAAFGGPYLADCLAVRTDFLKANPKTSQAIANAIVRAMQWLHTASVDDIMAVLPKDFYKADEAVYRESLAKNLPEFTWDGIVTPAAAQNVLKSISLLDPSLKSAAIDPAATYDNALIEHALTLYRAKTN